jgi:hypothetical protein
MTKRFDEASSLRLRSLGFEPITQGYRRGEWLARQQAGWWRLSGPWPAGQDPLGEGLPGLSGPRLGLDNRARRTS